MLLNAKFWHKGEKVESRKQKKVVLIINYLYLFTFSILDIYIIIVILKNVKKAREKKIRCPANCNTS